MINGAGKQAINKMAPQVTIYARLRPRDGTPKGKLGRRPCGAAENPA
jgi:hypothetical protein